MATPFCSMIIPLIPMHSNLPIFRVLSAAQYRFQHIAHSGASLLASMTAFPYLAIMVA